VPVDPPDFLAKLAVRLADDFAAAEVQADDPLRVRVFDPDELLADHRLDAQLLVQLTREAFLMRFANLALAAWKLPTAGKVRSGQAARQKETLAAFYDRGDHDDGCRSVSGHVVV